jgi:SAM (Sterile alpha motif) domain-containing protein/adenylate/guanylate cyclase family protein
MSIEITNWLRGLGLEQYASAFHDNAINAEVLRELTADDLKDLGVNLVGHRRKLLAAIAALRSGGGPQCPAADKVVSAAERRQITVMFCDVVDSTSLSTRLDPEDLREVLGAYQKCVAQTIGRYDGFVARYMGDGVLAYFGYPQAHEDDAERAVRAGLAQIEAVDHLEVRERLEIRIGIGTGLVVVGSRIPARDATAGELSLQARAGTRHCLQHAAARPAPFIARTDRPRPRGAGARLGRSICRPPDRSPCGCSARVLQRRGGALTPSGLAWALTHPRSWTAARIFVRTSIRRHAHAAE